MRYLIAIPLICALAFFACIEEKDEDDNDCDPVPDDCRTVPYTKGSLSVRLTINNENPSLNIYIYKGNIEDNILSPDISPNPVKGWNLPLYTISDLPLGSYSAKVDYAADSVTITCVDGDTISSKSHTYCNDVTCYDIENAELDLTFDYNAFKEYLEGTDEECFIATAAFGSPLASEVVTLRKFRDSVLRTSPLGKAFIILYYKYSPPAARFIQHHEVLRTVARGALYPMIWAVSYPRIFIATMIALTGICFGLIAGSFYTRKKQRD
jgi:hypothetical protein